MKFPRKIYADPSHLTISQIIEDNLEHIIYSHR